MYKVITGFYDLTDFKETKSGTIYHEYKEGDIYPRDGVEPSEDRIDMLISSENNLKTPLIKEVKEPNKANEKVKPKGASKKPQK